MKKKENPPKPKIQLDDWQKRILEKKGDLCICAGRQTGKSTIIAIKAAEFMIQNTDKFVMIVSTTEDQSILMLGKIHDYLLDNYKTYIKKGKNRVTKHHIELTNGSVVRTKAVGVSGTSIRGFTVDMLIVDEAALMPEDVWPAVTPMLLTTGGNIILISTPYGRRGYFYEAYHSSDFETFHVNSIEIMKDRPISAVWTERHREYALERLEKERKRMSNKQFQQEYLGQFVDDINQFFPDDLIKQAMDAKRPGSILRHNDYYLGVDIARMGEDESTFQILARNNDFLTQVESLVTTKTILTQTTQTILGLEDQYKFKRIYVDDEGLGIGVFDMLISNDATKRKIEALRNSRKTIDYKNDRKIKMLKEDLYFNLLRLMEQRKIRLLEDDNIYQSLKSVQYEHLEDKKGRIYMHIFGNYTHIVEGLIRAAWCTKDKNIKMLITSFKI